MGWQIYNCIGLHASNMFMHDLKKKEKCIPPDDKHVIFSSLLALVGFAL